MSYKIAIASGKGGTGKTSVSVHLLQQLSNAHHVTLVDCDVEEPNDHLFFAHLKLLKSEKEYLQVAQIDTAKCSYCRKCVEYCEFNAISVIPPVEYAKINADLCHSCGACLVACSDQAIDEVPSYIGETIFNQNSDNSKLIEGRLKIGSPMQTNLIRKLKKKSLEEKSRLILFDAPPGTSCPVVETIADTDYVIMVTEPTPFGLHDLKLGIHLIQEMNIPFGIIINKAGGNFKDTHEFIQSNGFELLAEIPFSKEYATIYSSGNILTNTPQEFLDIYQQIGNTLLEKIESYERDHRS